MTLGVWTVPIWSKKKEHKNYKLYFIYKHANEFQLDGGNNMENTRKKTSAKNE